MLESAHGAGDAGGDDVSCVRVEGGACPAAVRKIGPPSVGWSRGTLKLRAAGGVFGGAHLGRGLHAGG